MRLISYKKKLDDYRQSLELSTACYDAFEGKKYVVKGWKPYVSNLIKLKADYPFLNSSIEELISFSHNLSVNGDDLEISKARYDDLDRKINNLKKDIDFSNLLLSTIIIDDIHPTLNVAVSSGISLREAQYIVTELEYIVNECAPVRQLNENRDAILSRVDNGSIWFIINISCKALSFIGELFGLISETIDNMIDSGMILNTLKEYDALKGVIEKLAKEMFTKIQSEIGKRKFDILLNFNIEDNEENISGIDSAAKKMCSLIFHGVMLLASDNVANTKFPTEIKQLSALNILKDIRESSSHGTELVEYLSKQALMH